MALRESVDSIGALNGNGNVVGDRERTVFETQGSQASRPFSVDYVSPRYTPSPSCKLDIEGFKAKHAELSRAQALRQTDYDKRIQDDNQREDREEALRIRQQVEHEKKRREDIKAKTKGKGIAKGTGSLMSRSAVLSSKNKPLSSRSHGQTEKERVVPGIYPDAGRRRVATIVRNSAYTRSYDRDDEGDNILLSLSREGGLARSQFVLPDGDEFDDGDNEYCQYDVDRGFDLAQNYLKDLAVGASKPSSSSSKKNQSQKGKVSAKSMPRSHTSIGPSSAAAVRSNTSSSKSSSRIGSTSKPIAAPSAVGSALKPAAPRTAPSKSQAKLSSSSSSKKKGGYVENANPSSGTRMASRLARPKSAPADSKTSLKKAKTTTEMKKKK